LPAALPASTGSTFYVSPSGADSNPGTLELPWLTLEKAGGSVSPGQSVLVRAGTYPGWSTLAGSGTASAPISFRAYPGEQVTVTGRMKITGSWLRVSGFKFVGRTSANPSDVLVYVSGGDNIEISGNELTGSAMSAIYIGDPGNGADNVQFLRNVVRGNGTHTNLDHGIYYGSGRGGLIAGNLFEGNYAYGVHLYPDCDNAIVTQNTIVGNGRSGVIVGGESTTADGNLIVDNVIAFNANLGIRSYWGGPTGSGNVARNNVLYGNAEGDLATGTTAAGLTFSGNTIADPLFVNRAGGDYRLTAASPAVDRGEAAYALGLDLDGKAPQGAAADLGAYEH
jgi:parallel beta-helix repeat protein